MENYTEYFSSNWEGKSMALHIQEKFGMTLKVRIAQNLLYKLKFMLQRPELKFLKVETEKQK